MIGHTGSFRRYYIRLTSLAGHRGEVVGRDALDLGGDAVGVASLALKSPDAERGPGRDDRDHLCCELTRSGTNGVC